MISAGGAGSAGRPARPRAVADRYWSDSSRVFFLRFDGGDGGNGGDCDSTTVTTVCAVISTTVSIGLGPGPGRGAGPASRRIARDPRGDLDPVAEALRAIASDARIMSAEQVLRQASAELRFHEALRRRWREARAESAVRGAIASGGVEGVVLPSSVLRDAVAAGGLTEASTGEPSLDAVAGLWRAGTRLAAWMPDLRGETRPAQPSPRTLLATLHRDVAGPIAVAGRIPLNAVAVPRSAGTAPIEGGPGSAPDGEALTARLEGMIRLVDLDGVSALVRAAVVHGEMVSARPFLMGNAAVGRLLVRHLITRDGLEPTGVAVTDQYAARAPSVYADAVAAYAGGTHDGVVAWVVWQAEAILVGIQEAQAICRSVQAGTTAVE